ncbi:exotoxin [Clostridium perfringens]
MKKKLFFILLTCLISTFITNTNEVFAGSDPESIGINNLRNRYKYGEIIEYNGVKATNFSTSNTLNFDNISYLGKIINIKAEFNNEYVVSDLKDKKVDIYALSYQEVANDIYYIYGGVTPYAEKTEDKNIPINLWINGKKTTVPFNAVSVNKKIVTVQEIDIKTRRYLIEKYNLYNSYQSFTKGELKFHMKNEKDSFSLDLFYKGYGLSKSFLKIYNDNKIINIENLSHLDLTLS